MEFLVFSLGIFLAWNLPGYMNMLAIRGQEIADLRYEGLSVVSMEDHRDGMLNRAFRSARSRERFEQGYPGLLQLRIFISTGVDLQRTKAAGYYTTYFRLGRDSPVDGAYSKLLALDGEPYGPAGAEGKAALPAAIAARQDLRRNYYYTYMEVARTPDPPEQCRMEGTCLGHDFRVNPQTFSIQFRFLVSGMHPATSNVVTVPAEDIAAALASYGKQIRDNGAPK